MKKILFFVFFLFFGLVSFSQDFSNKGKEFWIPYPEHIAGTGSTMGIYLTSDVPATALIQSGGSSISVNLLANQVVFKFIGLNPTASLSNIPVYLGGYSDVVISGKGIHVTASSSIVVFAHIIQSARSGATLVLPTKVWGKEYIVPSYGNTGTQAGNYGVGELDVFASQPNTVIEITPAVSTKEGRPAGIPYVISLPKVGDIYQLQFPKNADLSGTKIKSIASGTAGCQPIAVFSATTWSGINCGGASGGDNFFQQIFPTSAWGKQFLTGPLKKVPKIFGDLNIDIIRVFVKDKATVVTKTETGVTTNLTSLMPGGFYEFSSSVPTFIQADQPIQVIQYITSQTCGKPQTNSDPEMIALSSIEQTINDITVVAATRTGWPDGTGIVPPGQSQVDNHYINVIMKTANTSLFKINGLAPAGSFTSIPGTAYSYLKEDITSRVVLNPISRLTADSGFSAIAYGFGNVESYGYNAGTNVQDLYTKLGIVSPYNIETSPSICIGESFKFKISLPYKADSIKWDFGAAPNPPSLLIRYPPGIPDSTTIVNGKTLYWYSTPGNYNYSTVNTYPINITTYSQNTDGCGSVQELQFDLDVSGPPVAAFTNTSPSCMAEQVQFTDATTSTKPTYKWLWNFGDPGSSTQNTSSLKNPVHTFSTAGPHTVTFSSITTAGCVSSTISKVINVPVMPTATIVGTVTTCLNSTSPVITFTGTAGTPPYIFSYTVDAGSGPGAAQTITTVSGNAVTVSVPTNIATTYTYKLLSIQNSNSTVCTNPQTGTVTVKIDPLPTATITGNVAVCQNTSSPVITFTGANGMAPYTFSYNIDGGVTKTIVTVTGNSVSVPCPTNIAGQFKYTLLKVQDASLNNCNQNQAGVVTVTVNPLPTATITGGTELCLNSTLPDITFSGAGGVAPYTFSYTINNGPLQTIKTISGNNIKLAVPTNVAGDFIYKLVSVQDGSATACNQPQTGSVLIKINPLPVAAFSFTVPSCENGLIVFDAAPSVANTGSITTWDWNFGDANSTTTNPNTSKNSKPSHYFLKPGTYSITLKITTDKGCVNTATKTVEINAKPEAGFIVPEVCLLDPFAQFIDTSKTIGTGSITAWEWAFGDATNSTPANPNTSIVKDAKHKYNFAGQYNVRLIAVTDKGCRDSITQVLTINGGNPSADFVPLNATANCANDTIAIQNKSSISSGNITRLEIAWDNDAAPITIETDEIPAADKIYKHKYRDFNTPLFRTYHIRVRAYSGGVCFSDKIKSINVNASPKIQFNSLPNGCMDVPSYILTQASEVAGVPGSGVYSGDGVSMGSTGEYIFNPSLAGSGTHMIKYLFTTTAGGCVDSVSRPVIVYANPVVNAGTDGGVLAGGSTTLQPTVTGTDLKYVWTWDIPGINGWLNNAYIKNPVASPLQDITYTLTVTGTGGCTVSDDVFIKVLQAPKIPNTFSPNNDGINDFWKIEYLDTYPDNRVQVFTRSGQKVFESRGYKTPWDGTLNGRSLPVDTYYYIIEPASGRKPITGYVTIIK